MGAYGVNDWNPGRGFEGSQGGHISSQEHFRQMSELANRQDLRRPNTGAFFGGRPWREQEGSGVGLGTWDSDRSTISRMDITPRPAWSTKRVSKGEPQDEAVAGRDTRPEPSGRPNPNRPAPSGRPSNPNRPGGPRKLSEEDVKEAEGREIAHYGPAGELGPGPSMTDTKPNESAPGYISNRETGEAWVMGQRTPAPRGELAMPKDQKRPGIAGRALQGVRRDMRTPNAPGATAPWMSSEQGGLQHGDIVFRADEDPYSSPGRLIRPDDPMPSDAHMRMPASHYNEKYGPNRGF